MLWAPVAALAAVGERGDEDTTRGAPRHERAGTVEAGDGARVAITSERPARTADPAW